MRRRLPEVPVLEGKLMWKVLRHAVRRSGARPSSPAPSAIDAVRHLLVLLLMLGCAAGLAGAGAAQDTVRVGPYSVPGNIDVVVHADQTDFHWRPLRLRIDYDDGNGPFDHTRVDVVWEATLHWSCPPGYYGQGDRRPVLSLPWHPDTEAYTVFNSLRVWWLWFIDEDVVHHEVEVVIGDEAPLRATVERIQASYSFARPRLWLNLPHRLPALFLQAGGSAGRRYEDELGPMIETVTVCSSRRPSAVHSAPRSLQGRSPCSLTFAGTTPFGLIRSGSFPTRCLWAGPTPA